MTLFLVCAVALLSTVGIALPYPILAPLFVAGAPDGFTQFMGLPPKLLLGVALAVNPLGILVGTSFTGALSDRYGRRRVMLATLLFTCAGYGVTALALEARLYPLFVLARFLTGLTESNAAVARAILADQSAPTDRVRHFALLNAAFSLGWLVGPMVGGFTLGFGAAVPFWLTAGAMLACALLVWYFMPETARPHAVAGTLWQAVATHHSFRLVALHPTLRQVFVVQAVFTLGLNAFYDFYSLWLVEFSGRSSLGIATLTALMCTLMTLASMGAGRLRLQPPLRGAQLHAVFLGVGMLALALLPGMAGEAVIVLMGLPIALYNAVLPAWCSERFASLGQGGVMGVLSTAFCAASVVVSLLGGVLSLLDTRWVLVLGGLSCLVAASQVKRLGTLAAPAA